jgi:hypothetical protein
MSNEDSQFDIPVIQLRESKTQPKVSFSREIGEAQITHTIFGRAKVRIIRKGDQARRYIVLAALAVVAVAAAAWQGLFSPQPSEPLLSAVPLIPINSEVQAGTPTFQPEYIASPATSPVIQIEPATPATVNTPSIIQKNVPQQPPAITVTEQKTVKPAIIRPKPLVAQPEAVTVQQKPVTPLPQPVTDQPLTASKLRTVPSKQPVPAVATQPASKPVVQPAASSPAAVAPLTAPPVQEDTTTQSPIGDKMLSAPVNVQSK